MEHCRKGSPITVLQYDNTLNLREFSLRKLHSCRGAYRGERGLDPELSNLGFKTIHEWSFPHHLQVYAICFLFCIHHFKQLTVPEKLMPIPDATLLFVLFSLPAMPSILISLGNPYPVSVPEQILDLFLSVSPLPN